MIKGNILNVSTEEIYPAEISINNGIITCVRPIREDLKDFILPGFIDAHIHIESSMLLPSRFAEAVVPHGTTSVVSDPHEIANVMGVAGIKYMMEDAASVPLNVFSTAPSCVPATSFETSGAVIGPEEIDALLEEEDVVALGEMMNFPGVLAGDPGVMEKIRIAQKYKKPVDGHAPLLSGYKLCKYIDAGISTDHECSHPEEVMEKRRLGMKIMLREGSSARNLADLASAGGDFIVSDDKHPQDLMMGHVDVMLKKGVEMGLDPVEAVKMVTLNPDVHYGLNRGSISPEKAADMVMVDNLENFKVKKVFIGGNLVARDYKALFKVKAPEIQNSFILNKKTPDDFEISIYKDLKEFSRKNVLVPNSSGNDAEKVRVIEVKDGQLLTLESEAVLDVVEGKITPDIESDVLKIAVVERYGHNHVSNAFVRGFGLKAGAIASSIAHDSHNLIVVGTSARYLADAVNILVKNKGGLVAVSDGNHESLELPVAGLMSTKSAREVSHDLDVLEEKVKNMGCELKSPFMTLSFLALLVIPKLKISDQGLFDVQNFKFVDVIKGNK